MLAGMKILLVNNGSKFILEIVNFLKSRGSIIYCVNPLIFDFKKINPKDYQGVVLSGGADIFWKERFKFNHRVIKKFKDKPLLGICLGHQFLIQSYGGALYKMDLRSEGMTKVWIIRENELTGKRKDISVYKSHQNSTAFLPDCLERLAYSTKCDVEIVRHTERPHFGIQFHPEKGGDGPFVIENFLKLCENYFLRL